MVVDDAEQVVGQRRRQVVVAGERNVTVDRVQEPQRAVDGVVLRAAGVGRVRQHPLRERLRRPEQQAASLVDAAGGQQQPLVGGHGVAGPVAEPRVAGDDGGTLDDQLVRGQGELCAGLVLGSRGGDDHPRPVRGPGDDGRGCRR